MVDVVPSSQYDLMGNLPCLSHLWAKKQTLALLHWFASSNMKKTNQLPTVSKGRYNQNHNPFIIYKMHRRSLVLLLWSAQVCNCQIISCPTSSYKVTTYCNLSELTLPVCCCISLPVKLYFPLIWRTPLILRARIGRAYSS